MEEQNAKPRREKDSRERNHTIAIPMYAMSCFKLPLKLCREINAMMSNYGGEKRTEKEKFTGASEKKKKQL